MKLRWAKSATALGIIGCVLIATDLFNGKASAQGLGFSSNVKRDCLNNNDVNHKRILRSITIGIDTPAGSGSGVVIGNNGNVWTALTAQHVYKGSKPNEIEIYSPAMKQYYEVLSTIDIAQDDVDLGIIKFRSNDRLNTAILNFNLLTPPALQQRPMGQQWGVTFDGAVGAGVSMPSGAVTVPVLRYTTFNLQERAEGNLNGYELLYQASTVPGMSGGPLLGFRELKTPVTTLAIGLIAIHGISEEYISGGRSGMSLAVPIDLAKDYLTKNADDLGIPRGYTKIVNLLRKQYCN